MRLRRGFCYNHRIMKIDPHSPIYSGGVRGKRRKSDADGASGFSGLMEGEGAEAAESAQAPSQIAAPPSVGGILSIQEVDAGQTRKGRAIRRSHRMLDALEELRISLLMGEVPLDQLEQVRTRMREQKEQVNDPHLREIINEIDIRAAVELAKYGY